MKVSQLRYIMNELGGDDNDTIHDKVEAFVLTATFNIYVERYADIKIDYDNELLIVADEYNRKNYIDFVDINMVREKMYRISDTMAEAGSRISN